MRLQLELGKLKFALGERPNLGKEIGASGTKSYAGRILEEYNVELQGQKAITVYDKMRRSDGMIRAILSAIILSIKSADWKIIGDEGVEEAQIEFLTEALFNKMTISFDEWLYHVLLMVPFGFSPFEKVFIYEDGHTWWRKLAPRLPQTLNKWIFDETGGLKGMEQYAMRNGKYEYMTIPVEKLLLFTMDREGSNYEGTSVLRSAYKHWIIKDLLYKISGIGLERQAVGLPVITLPVGAQDEDRDAAEDLVEKLRVNEKSGLVLPDGFTASILEGKLHAEDLLKHIQHHDSMIAKSVLAEFLQLGQEKQGGAYALSKDQSDFFLMSCEGYTKHIVNVMNRYAIPQLIDYNFPNVKVYPRLSYAMGKIDKYKLSEALKNLSDGQIIIPDDATEDFVRDKFGLPQADRTTRRPRIPTPIKMKERSIALAEGQYWRKLTKWEKSVKFAEIDDKFTAAEKILTGEMTVVAKWQIDDLVKQIEKAVETENLSNLYKITLHYRGDYAEVLRRNMKELAEFGSALAAAETNIKKMEISKELKNWLMIKADTITDLHASKMKSNVMLSVLNSVNAELSLKTILYNAKRDLQDYIKKELNGTASVVVGESINQGRNEIVRSGQFQAAQYSAILDERTCGLCIELDSKVVDLDDPDFDRFTPPVHSNCRCIWVYIHKEEERVIIDWKTPDQSVVDRYGGLVA